MTTPRTPPNSGCAPVNISSRGRAVFGRFFQKGRGESAVNPWIISLFYGKSLTVEQFFCRVGSQYPRVRLFSPRVALFSPHAAFFESPLFSLSILLKRKRKNGLCRGDIRCIRIHGLGLLYKKASTGFYPIHGLTRGYPWISTDCFIMENSQKRVPSTGPRVALPVPSLRTHYQSLRGMRCSTIMRVCR